MLARRPHITFAALALFGSFALIPVMQAQAPAAPPAPAAQQPAPIERQPPSDSDGQPGPRRGRMRPGMRQGMRPGMQGGMQHGAGMRVGPSSFQRGGHANFRGNAGARFQGGPGGFHGGPGGGFRGPQGRGDERGGMGDGHFGPGGMWWKNPMVVQRLTLTPDQVTRMDAIFQKSRIDLIDLKANLEKQEVMLEPLLSANPPDTAKASLQIDKVADARANLEKANAKMLLSIRGVLTADQWTKLHTHTGPGAPGSTPAPGPPAAQNQPGGPNGYGPGSYGNGYGSGNYSGHRGPGPAANAGPNGVNMDDTRP